MLQKLANHGSNPYLIILQILLRNIDFVEKIPNRDGVLSLGSNGGTLVVKCKDLRVIRIEFANFEEFMNIGDSLDKLSAIVNVSWSFPFVYQPNFEPIEDGWTLYQPEEEFAKLIHHAHAEWRISYVNIDYGVCPSYPRAVVVPANIDDEKLKASAMFRQGGRFPVLSYRHANSGNVIARCSQPLVGSAGRRCREDEMLMAAFNVNPQRKGFICDTRTATTIQSAKAKGGGQEPEAYYPRWKTINRSIDRYHYLLDSYSKLMEAVSDVNCSHDKWMNRLTISSWLTHVKDILTCGCLVAQCLERVSR